MKVIELLNKIANGEELPKEIMYGDKIFIHNGFSYTYENKTFNECNRLEEFISYSSDLNNEVEIIKNNEKKSLYDLGLTLDEIESFLEAKHIFVTLKNEEDKYLFIKLLLGERTYQRWIDNLENKGDNNE